MSLTDKQEAFVQAYLETGNGNQAYRAAYNAENMKDSVVYVKASELLKNGKVTVRLEQLRSRHQKRHDITVDRLTDMAVAAYDLALRDDVKAPAAAVSALLAIGKLHGLVVDKKEVTQKRDAADLTIEELYTIARLGSARNTAEDAGEAEPDRVHEIHVPRLSSSTAPRLDS